MHRLLLIPILLLSMLTARGLSAGPQISCEPAEAVCTSCTCIDCPCCLSEGDPVPDRPEPARVAQGPRIDWGPAPERAALLGWSAQAAAPRVCARPAAEGCGGGRVRLHARIGVWLT